MPDDNRGNNNPTAEQDRTVLDPAQIARLELAIERLGTRDREIFLSASRDRLPFAEIARQHRCSVTKVQKVIARALVALHRSVWPD